MSEIKRNPEYNERSFPLSKGGIPRPISPSDREAIRSAIFGTPIVIKSITTGGASYVPEVELYEMLIITAQAEALTIANPTNRAFDGKKFIIRIQDNGTARALSFGSEYRSTTATLPTTTTVNKWTYMGFMRNDFDSKWDLLAVTTEA